MALKAHLASPQPADNHTLIEGRRQSRRALRLETSGSLPGGSEANVTIHNISAVGLLLETQSPLNVGETLSVDLPNVGPVGAEIVWESGQLFGCAFQQALGEASLAAAQLRGAPAIDSSFAVSAKAIESGGAISGSAFGRAGGDPLGLRLNRLRRERGLTLAQVATTLGVSKPTVWAWEKGKARPLPERIAAIAQVLGVSEADLNAESPDTEGAALIEECRTRIAAQFGADPKSVRIMIEV